MFIIAGLISPKAALTQETPAPAPTAAPPGGFDLSKLTPAQQAALQQAIVKTSQNPVGNIAIIPFQNNFNYALRPFARYQYKRTKPGALIWGAGPIFQLPTAQPQVLGSGKWSAGPAVVGLVMPGHFVMGIL